MPLFRKKEKSKNWKRKNPRIYSGVPRRDKQGKKGRTSRFVFWLLLAGFLGVAAYLLLFSPLLEIEAVSVQGNRNIPAEEILARVNKTLEGKYLEYFSKRNFFLASRRAIASRLKADFNRLEVWAVEKKFPNAILVKVRERQPELAWCSGGVCYLADKSGQVFSGADATDEELNKNRFLIVVDDNARPVEIGKTSLGEDFVRYLKEIDALLVDELGLAPEGAYHTPSLSSQEIIAKIKEGEGWLLKLTSSASSAETKKILETVFEKELPSEKRSGLEYLDLRVKGKVYYKFK